jgi:endonuclease-8
VPEGDTIFRTSTTLRAALAGRPVVRFEADRLRARPPEPGIGVALLDQRVACGVGNVYKSETLFACRADPFARVGDLDVRARRDLLAKASELLRRDLSEGSRSTYGGGLAVHGRSGRPCPRCGYRIRSRRRGEGARTTYRCPSCQAPREAT